MARNRGKACPATAKDIDSKLTDRADAMARLDETPITWADIVSQLPHQNPSPRTCDAAALEPTPGRPRHGRGYPKTVGYILLELE